MLFEYFMSFPVERMLRFMCDNDEKPSRSCCLGECGLCHARGDVPHRVKLVPAGLRVCVQHDDGRTAAKGDVGLRSGATP